MAILGEMKRTTPSGEFMGTGKAYGEHLGHYLRLL